MQPAADSPVTCSTCVAVAIAQRHTPCLRALLQQGKLLSDHFFLPVEHLLNSKNNFQSLDNFISKWPCRSLCSQSTSSSSTENQDPKSSETNEIRNSQPQTLRSGLTTESIHSCDHLFVSEPEKAHEYLKSPEHSAFLAFSITRLALESTDTEIRSCFLQNAAVNFNIQIIDNSLSDSPPLAQIFLQSGFKLVR